MSKDYYSKKLSANRLKQCYEIASERIKQYFAAEIQFVLDHVTQKSVVLELGCGYGRVLKYLAEKAQEVFGIDISQESLSFAREYLIDYSNVNLYQMDAESLTFTSDSFDLVIGIQNSISAFKVEPFKLLTESLRVTKPNGKLLLSSYSENIWDARLEWFIQQANEGLLGEIDLEKSKDGTIIGKDGFKATTYTRNDFQELIDQLDLDAKIVEVDNSSLFCVIAK
ncbi:MAG: class I SAM-dependent methyltransferase [Asgard group archaeon]|nr:class I SAM-dependent methyltransferase [Asgard group archaeon]